MTIYCGQLFQQTQQYPPSSFAAIFWVQTPLEETSVSQGPAPLKSGNSTFHSLDCFWLAFSPSFPMYAFRFLRASRDVWPPFPAPLPQLPDTSIPLLLPFPGIAFAIAALWPLERRDRWSCLLYSSDCACEMRFPMMSEWWVRPFPQG